MKRLKGLLLILSVIFLANSCDNDAAHMHEDEAIIDFAKEKLEISLLLDNLAAASESGNFEMIEKIWWPSEEVLLIGTDRSENLEGWEDISAAIIKQFGTFEGTLISITDQSIWLNKDANVGWFFEELNYNFVYENKAMTFEGIRFTGVMQKMDGKWRLVQQHMSIPAQLEMVETN
ncbi:MAG: nuclear transport factor 2 family protein [Bacteroidales bacterium]|jgi:ketosteroid isomerase-like protein|nr:nuclear transport factor 2 family protein [Bacteroidales bacterium]